MNGVTRTIRASWAPVLVFVMLVAGMMIGGRTLSSQAYDQNLFHIQVVRQFESQWPAPDLSEYNAATGPGYHLAMTAIGRVIGSELITLRMVSAIFGIALICTAASLAAIAIGTRSAALLVMPLATSYYVIGSGMYVHTDNAAWLCALLAVGPLVFRPVSMTNLLAAACFGAIAVSIRQSFIWIVGPIILAGILSSPIFPSGSGESGEDRRKGWGDLVGALMASVPAVIVLGVLFALWGGMIQDQFRPYHDSKSQPGAYGFAFAVLGLYAPFFLICIPELGARVRALMPWILGAAAIAAIASMIGPSVPSVEEGRNGGPVWMLAGLGPAIAERSIMLACLAAFGGGSLALLLGSAALNGRRNAGLIAVCAWVAAMSPQVLNSQAFQRYFDTPALILLIWLVSLVLVDRRDSEARSALGPPLLAVVLGFLLMVRII